MTRSGRVEGRQRGRVLEFRGIPFARPPVGARRFAPPEREASWTGTRPAVASGLASPQLGDVLPSGLSRMIGLAGEASGEDCLYLNVWTPAADDQRRPVLVWIHGGAFVLGSGSGPLYSGRHLAQRNDVVVVTLNYRLGALGFLNLAALADDPNLPANVGLQDQIAALEWVRESIGAFGGDPDNVTIFGESAGGMSVGTLLGTPSAKGLFHRAVCQSGAASNVSDHAVSREIAQHFLSGLGVSGPDLDALRDLRLAEILRGQRELMASLVLKLGAMPWQPGIDGALLAESPLEAVSRGVASDVSLLVGTNRDEWDLFMLGDAKGRRMAPEDLRRRYARSLKPDDVERAAVVYRRPRRKGANSRPRDSWAAFQTDRVFFYPATQLAEAHASQSPQTYMYRFDWSPRLTGRFLGAAHGLEIPFVFGTYRHPITRGLFGAGAGALSRQMQDAWTSFARDGRPSGETLPAWTPYDAERRVTLRFGRRSRVEERPFETERQFWQSLSA